MNEKGKIHAPLNSFTLPKYNEIPDVGLYLDQVTKYINGLLVDFPEMQVTPSMISNYVKLKLVSKATKKTYSREQIAYFIFIALGKTVLSMDHLRMLFATQKQLCPAEDGYEYFRSELEKVLTTFNSPAASDSDSKNRISEERRLLHNICVTIAHKMYLDRYFYENAPEVKKEEIEAE